VIPREAMRYRDRGGEGIIGVLPALGRALVDSRTDGEPPRSGLVEEYTAIVGRAVREEQLTRGEDRLGLGFVASGIARFLRRQAWTDPEERRAGLALAERADEVARKCLGPAYPAGNA
jgi:hypothetical protein